ncbi:MAG: hypothetical protein JO168_13680 [Solirubrobacterales bacterium]|nr:hypothetical protein [Solirubrobacterales bacterium]
MLVAKSFADIPAEVQRRVDAGERVILIVLDSFGLEFLERHRDHAFIQRLDVTSSTSQFPSTTTAHVSAVHSGCPCTSTVSTNGTFSSQRSARSSARCASTRAVSRRRHAGRAA